MMGTSSHQKKQDGSQAGSIANLHRGQAFPCAGTMTNGICIGRCVIPCLLPLALPPHTSQSTCLVGFIHLLCISCLIYMALKTSWHRFIIKESREARVINEGNISLTAGNKMWISVGKSAQYLAMFTHCLPLFAMIEFLQIKSVLLFAYKENPFLLFTFLF